MREPTEMELKVADAITSKMEEWHGAGPAKSEAVDYARAAIRAMREPTVEMLKAADRHYHVPSGYFAMIDAASPEVTPPAPPL